MCGVEDHFALYVRKCIGIKAAKHAMNVAGLAIHVTTQSIAGEAILLADRRTCAKELRTKCLGRILGRGCQTLHIPAFRKPFFLQLPVNNFSLTEPEELFMV